MSCPNILLITTDQHNAEILGVCNPCVRTPNLDRLAAEGVLCDAAFTPHSVCTPARTTIFTGQYAHHHGVPYNINLRADVPPPPHHTGLSADAVAFPEALARAGYRTALFGKLHTLQAGGRNFGLQLARLAEGKGHFVGYGAPPDDYRQYLARKGYPDAAWQTWELPEYARDGFVTSPIPDEDYIDTWIADEALEYLAAVEEPFFVWASFCTPHNSWDPPAPYDTMYRPDEVRFPSRRRGELEEKHPNWVDHLARTIPPLPWTSTDPSLPGGLERAYGRLADDQVRALLAAYYGQISHVDHQVGRLLSLLDERGLRENTLALFTSDHGDHLGNNWAFYKYGACYDSLARVPLIASWPGRIEGGRRTDRLVCLTDLAPTFLAAAGVEPSAPLDGRSLLGLFDGAESWREELVLGPRGQVECLLAGEWKYLRWKDGFEELYHRGDDPHDLHNLAARTQHRERCETLSARLTELVAT